MNMDEFREVYVFNSHRNRIFLDFLDYANTVNEYLSPYLLLTYGSFVSGKEYPNDIDILLHGFVKTRKFREFDIRMLLSRNSVHVTNDISALMQETKLMTASELVEWFETGETNKSNGIRVGKWVQIDF
jgi:hypothetical protein